jgi:hypothetical protein
MTLPAAARQRALIEKLCTHALRCYQPDGAFTGPYTAPDERDRFRAAAILAEHGGAAEIALAETLIRGSFGGPEHDVTQRTLEQNIVDIKKANVLDWNIFQSNIATVLVAKHAARLAPDVRDKLLRLARRNVSRFAGSGQPDYFFHGANDNMPAHATSGLIIGGQLCGDERAVQDGVYRLELFAEMLQRRGLCSEYASGTYLPLTIMGIAEIVELARDPAVRELALAIEHQLWADIVGHYHPGSGKSAGGQTRAYTVNTIAHLDCIMFLLWAVTGEPAFTDPVRDIITLQPRQVTHFEGDSFKTACGLVYCATAHYHFPEHLRPLLTRRPYPFRLRASAEHMYAGHGDVGGREAHATCYQTADYALATSDHGFMTGNQSEKLRITYRRVPAPRSFHDTGVLFLRYLHHDELPGQPVTLPNCATGEAGLVADRALTRTLQHDDLALYVTRADSHNVPLPASFTRLRLATILPAHYHDAAAVWLGDREVRDWTAACAAPCPVFLDFGQLYLALYPLAMTNHGRSAAVRLEQIGHYRMVSFYNYEGPAREFDAATLRETFNGAVVQVSGPAESGSFAQFRANFRLDLVEDWWFAGNRRTRVICRGHELLHNWSAHSDTVRSATIDGLPVPTPRFEATGVDLAQFPLLSGRRPITRPLPYDDLNVAWYPQMTWQIGDRGSTVTG